MEELIACIARSLVKNPEAVTVTKIQKKASKSINFMSHPKIWAKSLASKVKLRKHCALLSRLRQ